MLGGGASYLSFYLADALLDDANKSWLDRDDWRCIPTMYGDYLTLATVHHSWFL